MKTFSTPLSRTLSSNALAAVLLLALTPICQAKDKGHGGGDKGHGNEAKGHAGGDKGHGHDDKGHGGEAKVHVVEIKHQDTHKMEQKFESKEQHKNGQGDHNKVVYMAHPHTNFVLSPGNGYAGRGYYYGPPNSSYYYQRPEVQYFDKRESFPSGYSLQPNSQNMGDEAAVQQALARLGYYQGPIDGRLGPQSQRAISQYQQSRGMSVTNSIVPALLQALGLQ